MIMIMYLFKYTSSLECKVDLDQNLQFIKLLKHIFTYNASISIKKIVFK